MRRRSFIRGLLGLAVAPLAIPALAKPPAPTLNKGMIRQMEERLSGAEVKPWPEKVEQWDPVFSEYLQPINPFDLYALFDEERPSPSEVISRGTTGIPVGDGDQVYLSMAPIIEYRGKLYLRTSTVPPKTKAGKAFIGELIEEYKLTGVLSLQKILDAGTKA